MYVGRDFDVAENIEEQTFGFDFVNDVAIGDTVADAAWTIKVAADSTVADPAVNTRLVSGAASFGGTKAFQRFKNLIEDCRYCIECLATMASGDKVALHSFVLGKNPAVT